MVGRVQHTYHFNDPVDFRFLPGSSGTTSAPGDGTSSVATTTGGGNGDGDGAMTVLEAAPVPLQRFAMPELLFRSAPLASASAKAGDDVAKHQPAPAGAAGGILFGAPVPTAPPRLVAEAVAGLRTDLRREHDAAVAVLAALFERRPVWSRAALETECAAKLRGAMAAPAWPEAGSGGGGGALALAQISFRVADGPFADLHARLGYDSARRPEARALQVRPYLAPI